MPNQLEYQMILKVLSQAKYLVDNDLFELVTRKSHLATPVNRSVAKYLFSQLKISDFHSYEPDLGRPGEYLWIFHEPDDDVTYYIKFKLLSGKEVFNEGKPIPELLNDSKEYIWVKFISFHPSYYN